MFYDILLDAPALSVGALFFSPKVFAGLLKFLVLYLLFGVERNRSSSLGGSSI